MSRLVCPICGENLEEEGDHFYRHLNYKKFPCGESGCSAEFYSGVERNAHCSEMKHKRSFQNNIFPYMDNLITMVVEDARTLAVNDKNIDAIIKKRWGSNSSADSSTDTGSKKRNSTSSTTPAAKKSKSGGKATFATSSADSSTRPSDEGATQATSSTSSLNLPNPADSTTNDSAHFETPTVVPAKKQRKKRDSATQKTPSAAAATETEEEVPDELVPKIKCNLCPAEIPYDLKCRNAHGQIHLSDDADVTSPDFDEVLKAAVDKAFPDLPNGALNCQLCIGSVKNIRLGKQMEHIEKMHKNEIPELKCPECGKAFERQCRLSGHMLHQHQMDMTQHPDPEFRKNRARRLTVIAALRKKYFPISYQERKKRVTKQQKQATTTTATVQPEANPPSGPLSAEFEKDIRVREWGKTRRAPQYREDSSSDENEDEEEAEDDDSSLMTIPEGIDCSADIVFVEQRFISEVTQRLLSRAATPLTVSIKQEVVDPTEEEEMKVETNESSVKPDEQHRPPTPSYPRFDPTAPPPGYPLYQLLHSHPGAELVQPPPPPPPPLSTTRNKMNSPGSTTSAPATTRNSHRDRDSRERIQSPRRQTSSRHDNRQSSSSQHHRNGYDHRRGGDSSRNYMSDSGGSFPSSRHHQNRSGGGGERRTGGAQSENENRDRARGTGGGYYSTSSPYSRPRSSNSHNHRGGRHHRNY